MIHERTVAGGITATRLSAAALPVGVLLLLVLYCLLAGCSTFERKTSEENAPVKEKETTPERASARERILIRIAERTGYYNGKLASADDESRELSAFYEERLHFWNRLKTLFQKGDYVIPDPVVDMLVQEDERLLEHELTALERQETSAETRCGETIDILEKENSSLRTTIEKKDSSMYLLVWEIERLKGLLSQAGIDTGKDSYIESFSVEEIIDGLSDEEIQNRLHMTGRGDPIRTGFIIEELLRESHGTYDEYDETGVQEDTLSGGDRYSHIPSDTLLSLSQDDTAADSLYTMEDALFRIVSDLMTSFEHRLAHDLITASFADDMPPRFVEIKEKASNEDIAERRNIAAESFLKAKELWPSRPDQSLNLMRNAVAILDELIAHYPDHGKISIIRANRKSIVETMTEFEDELNAS
jgi:hypothetical protein